MRAAAGEGYTTATAVADTLVRRGVAVPCRPPHRRLAGRRRPRTRASVWTRSPTRWSALALAASGDPTAAGAGRGPGHRRRAAGGRLDRRRARIVRRHRRHRARPGSRPRSPRRARLDRAWRRPDSSRRTSIRPRTIRAMLADATIAKAPKALLHDHLDGGLRPATVIDLAAEYGYDAPPDDRRRRPRDLVPARRRSQEPRALPRDLRPHVRGHAVARRDRPGRGRMRRGPRRRRRRLRRGPDGARAVHRAGPDPRRGDRRDARRLPDRLGARGRGRPPDRR